MGLVAAIIIHLLYVEIIEFDRFDDIYVLLDVMDEEDEFFVQCIDVCKMC